MTKKILLVIGILAAVGIAVFLILYSKPQTDNGNPNGFSIRDYLPFGKGADTNTSSAPAKTNDNPPTSGLSKIDVNKPIPRLRKISNEPIAGAVVFDVGSTSVVRFVEKGTGNVYEARSDTLSIQRLTNTTIPKIIRAFWLPNGSGFLAQTLVPESEIVETSFVKLNKNAATTSSESLTPFSTTIGKLPTDIKEISIKPDSNKIFYYTINGASSNWFISNPDGTGSVLVNSHPLTEWLPEWLTANTIIMQSKGSAESVGFSYSFDTESKILKKIGVAIKGLSANPKNDGLFTIASGGNSFPQLFMVDNKNVSAKGTRFNTLAEKCVWLKDKKLFAYCATPNQIPTGTYPDDWYKGTLATEDSIRKIDFTNSIDSTISDLSRESNQKIDVIDLSLSPNETHLVFRNKIDGYLWLLRIGE